LKWTKNPEAAKAFRAFLLAPEGRAILKRYGFSAD
jgi:ABC-type molybdate transport system substrate-binding protein